MSRLQNFLAVVELCVGYHADKTSLEVAEEIWDRTGSS